jgi:predicted SAM-dependent methyltransferase
MYKFLMKGNQIFKFLLSYLPAMLPYFYRKVMQDKINSSEHVYLIVGSGGDKIEDWISSDYPIFDLKNYIHWEFFFNKRPWEKILAEHVLEHLYLEDFKDILKLSKKYAAEGATLRVAVPDGYSTLDGYIDAVKPGGTGAGAFDHKVLYDYMKMKKISDDLKIKCSFVEYFDENGNFFSAYSEDNGFIKRCKKNDPRNSNILQYTSLIVDFYF